MSSRSGRAETRSRTKDDLKRVMQSVDKVSFLQTAIIWQLPTKYLKLTVLVLSYKRGQMQPF